MATHEKYNFECYTPEQVSYALSELNRIRAYVDSNASGPVQYAQFKYHTKKIFVSVHELTILRTVSCEIVGRITITISYSEPKSMTKEKVNDDE